MPSRWPMSASALETCSSAELTEPPIVKSAAGVLAPIPPMLMIAPRRSLRCGQASRASRTAPWNFKAKPSRKSSSVSLKKSPRLVAPALLTRMSMRPSACTAAAITFAAAVSSRRSATKKRASTLWRDLISSARALSAASSRATSITATPSCATPRVGGCRNEAVEILLAALADCFGPPHATIIGRSERTDALTATFFNAVSANVLDFDDTHLRTVIHPTAPVAPGLFALAERRPIAGAALLHAFVLGVEVECRIGNALSPGHYRRGWHITATCGVLGAAAAAGKLLGLDTARMGWALGAAATQSSGLIENLGTMSKSVGVGNSARNGLAAALYAERGLSGPDQPLEGPRGLAAVMGEDVDLSSVTHGLGDSWELMQNAYKPYPCGVVLHPVIDACLELR